MSNVRSARMVRAAVGSFAVLAVLFFSDVPRMAAQAQEPAAINKVLLDKADFVPTGPGVTLWHDYGTFALYRVTDAALAGIPVEARRRLAPSTFSMDTISLEAAPFNPLQGEPVIPEGLRADPAGDALQIVQFVGPIKSSWLEAIEARGVKPIHYIESNAYLVWAGDGGREALSEMVAGGDFLQYSGAYHPFYKFDKSLRKRVVGLEGDGADDEVVPVLVQMYRHGASGVTEQMIRDRSQATLSEWTPILAYQNIIVELRVGDLAAVAARPDVYWIGERLEREMFDEVQGQIMAANFNGDQSGPGSTGYLTWLLGKGVSTDPADYPILTVVDDGIGDGTVNSGDPTLHESGSLLNPTRLAFVDNCTNSSTGAGVDGHGHINVSIAGGYDTRAGFPFQDDNDYQRGLGINPFGRFGGTRIFDPFFDLSSCGNTDTGTILDEQNAGADMSTNSWGCSGCAGTYDDGSQAYDVGVRDADLSEAGNQQLIIFFSAGNSGPGSNTIGTPGNGKNMITVGASENDRPTWTDGCLIGPSGADDAMDVINFSSRGPAPGGRIKPEIIAPGTHIQGTASTYSGYTGSSVCDQYEPGGQTVFAASSGTSHSTPAVAGLGTLYYHWMEVQYGITPSPAMMKAYMIAHPTYLTGVGANDTLPSNSQGYGMPDMEVGMDDAARFLLDQSVVFNNSGESWTFTGGIADPARPVRIVMCYTDAAGAIGTSPQVNNLNLSANVGGTNYIGNEFSGQWSITGGSFDTANNYEAIFLPPGTNGVLEITVNAFNIAGDGVPNSGDGTDQDFAIMCYNCSQDPDFTIDASPEAEDVCVPDDATYTVEVGQLLGYTDPVTLAAAGAPAGATVSFSPNPVTPPGTSTMTVGTASAAIGTTDFDIVGTSTSGTHDVTVSLTISDAAPGTPLLLTPSNGETDVPLQPEFTWSTPSQASTYDVEVATDEAFTNIVASDTGLAAPTFTPGSPLVQQTQYYWRVQVNNACGSTMSAPSTFITSQIACIQFASTDVPVPISSSGTPTVTSEVTVEGIDVITDVNVLLLQGTHTWIGDLDFNLESPTGTTVQIMDQECGSQNNFDINFDDDGIGPPPAWPCPPTDGNTYQPSQPLAAFIDESGNGVWTLIINDNANSDGGSLNSWTLEVCGSAKSTCLIDEDCDDGFYCNGEESCITGTCVAGTPVVCDDGVGCTVDSCDEVTDSCSSTPDDGACSDGLFCNGAEVCDAVNDCQAGTPPDCDDGISCTNDFCNGFLGICGHTPVDANCDNGLFCDGVETCDAVNDCQAGTPPVVDDGVDCTVDVCDEDNDVVTHVPDDAFCDNGLFCDGAETCDAVNGCQAGEVPGLDDGVDCTVDACDEGSGSITHTPSDAFCDNGLFCDGVETCDAVNDCQAGTPLACDDGVACTDDLCNEGTQDCVYTPNDANCDNGLFCDGAETCDVVNDCQAGTPPVIDDGVDCTSDFCDEDNDVVAHVPDNAACDNGLFCDGAETCDAVNDCQPGSPVVIDDGIECTTDFCDEVDDMVVHVPDDLLCDDGLFCNGVEACDTVGGCLAGLDPCPGSMCDEANDECVECLIDGDCEDGDVCTTDTCIGGFCDSVNNSDPCDDGFLCTDSDTCIDGACVGVPIPDCGKCDLPSDCDDGNPCTDDLCPAGVCEYVFNSATCDDGSVCTDGDVCMGGTCMPGPPLDCDDGDACTTDSCDAIDGCMNEDLVPPDQCCDSITGDLTTINDGLDCTDDVCNGDGTVDHFDTCPPGEFCDAGLNACSSPVTMVFSAPGMFRLRVELLGGGTATYALHVSGDAGNEDVACVSAYVQEDGTLGATPVARTAQEWGAVVDISGPEVIPGTMYQMDIEGIQAPEAGVATTWSWGDVNGNGVVNLEDVQLIVFGFQGEFPVPLEQMDLEPCQGNGSINFADIQADVLAFQGATYATFGCPLPCSAGVASPR